MVLLFAAAFASDHGLGLTMVAARGLVMLPFGLLGVAGAIAYTLPPVRAAYRPVAGEAIAFGCLLLCVVGARCSSMAPWTPRCCWPLSRSPPTRSAC